MITKRRRGKFISELDSISFHRQIVQKNGQNFCIQKCVHFFYTCEVNVKDFIAKRCRIKDVSLDRPHKLTHTNLTVSLKFLFTYKSTK